MLQILVISVNPAGFFWVTFLILPAGPGSYRLQVASCLVLGAVFECFLPVFIYSIPNEMLKIFSISQEQKNIRIWITDPGCYCYFLLKIPKRKKPPPEKQHH